MRERRPYRGRLLSVLSSATRVFGKRILVNRQPRLEHHRSRRRLPLPIRRRVRVPPAQDPHVVSFSPIYHWTEQKIRVHTFYCVLALTIARLMRRHVHQHDLDLSVPALLDALARVQESVLLYPSGSRGRPKARHILTDRDAIQRRLYDIFGLDRWAPGTRSWVIHQANPRNTDDLQQPVLPRSGPSGEGDRGWAISQVCGEVSEVFTARIVDEGKLGAFVVLVSFLVTFVGVRVITHAVRRKGTWFRNVRVARIHVHHLVPGIVLIGCQAVDNPPRAPSRWC